jgi:hypothetical protein
MEKDHLEVLLEEMKGRFDFVLAGIDIILHEIQETRQELGEKIDMNTFRLRALGKKLDSIAEDSI